MAMRVLLLGGTTEAMALAHAMARAGIDAVYSLAGRTERPQLPPIPHRIGGFGGIAGLRDWLGANGTTHVVDATHPFAAQMSRHAAQACAALGLPLIALERPEWTPGPGERWTRVPDIPAAVAALPTDPTHVFLAIGRQEVAPFAAAPQHRYLLRLVDAAPVPGLPGAAVVVSRGPFDVQGDLALMRDHGTQVVVAKNAGGEGARAKLEAARELGLPVVMVDRPACPPGRQSVATVAGVMDWLSHPARLGV